MTRLTLAAPIDGWLLTIGEVPDPVFADRLLGDGVAIDPLADTLHAPAAGTILSVHEAGHAVTLRLAAGPVLLMHFGLETVRLGGAGFTPLVAAGQQVAAGDPLLRVDLAKVATVAKSLATPIVITETAGHSIEWCAVPGRIRQGEPMLRLVGTAQLAPEMRDFVIAARRELRVPLAHGLHARPSARLAELARTFDAEVRAIKGDRDARLSSPSGMMTLGIAHGDRITIAASGAAAQVAVDAIAEMIETGMGEGRPFAPVATPRVAPPVIDTRILRDGTLSGVAASAGFVTGIAAHFVRPEPMIAEISEGASTERLRLATALAAVRDDLDRDDDSASFEQRAIAAAHRALLADTDLIQRTQRRIDTGESAAMAWRQVVRAQADALRAAPDPHIAERAGDLIDVEVQVQWRLAGQVAPAIALPPGAILLADDLVPSQVAALDPAKVAGIVTARGGPTSHVAIIAAGSGIPALVAVGPAVLAITAGTPLILDTAAGTLIVDPDATRWHEAQVTAARHATRKVAAHAAARCEGRTADGHRIEVLANLGKHAEAAPAVAGGAEGCGLLRTEFLFLERAVAPDEDEQTADYTAIASALEGRPLVIRLLDIGGDKPAPYLPIAVEENPALGLRGIRVALAYPDVLGTQLRAILRAAPAGDVRIMVPMIATVTELRAVRAALETEVAALGHGGGIALGVMVETPAAAVMADRLAAECDFLSIGTNDLTQYTLAMDRGNPAVASHIDGLDPAVLRMIEMCCRGGAAHGKPVSVCGGLASDRLAVAILIGLGVTKLSAAPAAVAEIKALVRGLSRERCRTLAAAVVGVSSAHEVRVLAAAMLEEVGL